MPATSDKQRKFMGIVRGIQKGSIPRSYSPEAARVAKTIDPKSASEYAKDESITLDSIWRSIISEQSDISPDDVYTSLGERIADIRHLASAHNNDSELIKIHAQFAALHVRLRQVLAKLQGQ